jgi:hypothetical protein
MTTEIERELRKLRMQYGQRWEIWVVHRVYGGPVWAARLHHNHKRVLNADSADHLAEYIQEAEKP